MDRREMLMAGGAMAMAAMAGSAAARPATGQEPTPHQHMHHGKSPYAALMESAAHCSMTGERCVSHCIMLLSEGDKELGACARSASQMLAICGALRSLAAQEASQLPKLAKLAMDVCKECEDECRKHENKHEICKMCAEACADCAKECKAVAA